jgi:hypothetical protein
MAHREQYQFNCDTCHYVWQMTYDVRDLEDPEDDSKLYFYLTGIPASSPLDGRRCPNCWEATYTSQLVEGGLQSNGHLLAPRQQFV